MKKFMNLFAFCFLLSALCLNAQPIQFPDSSFETWESKSGYQGTYLDFATEFFVTLNALYGYPNDDGPSPLTAERSPKKQHGQWSIELTSGQVPVGESYIFLPGVVGTIAPEFIEEFLRSPDGSIPVAVDWLGYDTPHALEGWYWYEPVANDSALIEIAFYQQKDVETFCEKIVVKNKVAKWTHFSVPIPKQYWDTYFEQIRVLFVASAGVNFDKLTECKGQVGSKLWIDNINLNYSDIGIKQDMLSTLRTKAYPNPANEVVNIDINEHFIGTVSVYSINGAKVMEQEINDNQSQLNVSTLSNGNYVYKLMNGNTIFAQGKFVVTK